MLALNFECEWAHHGQLDVSGIRTADSNSRIFNLNGINVDNFASTAKSIGAAFRDADILDLALFLELL